MSTWRPLPARKKIIILLLFYFLACCLPLLSACFSSKPKICRQDGQIFCLTSDKIQVMTWDACYRRGVSCMEGLCWEYAMEEFTTAIFFRFEDQRQVRAYGMHFREEYFPHRELGICYYYAGKITEALLELELSLSQAPSSRAFYYLNQARASYVMKNNLDLAPPVITLSSSGEKYLTNQTRFDLQGLAKDDQEEYLTNQTRFQVQGLAKDDQYVAAIWVNEQPLFIELAKPAIAFDQKIKLAEGWNNIEIKAYDLLGRKSQKTMRILLDRDPPLVLIYPLLPQSDHPLLPQSDHPLLPQSDHPLLPQSDYPLLPQSDHPLLPQSDHPLLPQSDYPLLPQSDHPLLPQSDHLSNQLTVVALVYDPSGLASFHIEGKEITKAGLGNLWLVEEKITLSEAKGTITFDALDQAGNLVKGEMTLPSPEKVGPKPLRLACVGNAYGGDEVLSLAGLTPPPSKDLQPILVRLTNPPQDTFTTCYEDIFLEGKIEAKEGLKKITLNGRLIYHRSQIDQLVKENLADLTRMLKDEGKQPEQYLPLLQEIVRHHTHFFLNQRLFLDQGLTKFSLSIEDAAGNHFTRDLTIRKIPREEIFPGEQRLIMALLPFDPGKVQETDLQRFINAKLVECFTEGDRFNLVEREKLPWVLIEKYLQEEGTEAADSDLARSLAELTPADGLICGYIQKRMDGVEIMARFIEVETGLIRLFHDVFAPSTNPQQIQLISSGLASKFRDSFPLCTGKVLKQKGDVVQINLGAAKGLFPGMLINIFMNEKELMAKANIYQVDAKSSEAKIQGKVKELEANYLVRTR